MLLKCKHCLCEFSSPITKRQFCSKTCSIAHRKTDPVYLEKLRKPKTTIIKVETVCSYCNTQFTGKENRKFCSTSCSNKDRLLNNGYLIHILCKECNQAFKPVRSSTQFCSNTCSHSNRLHNVEFLNKLSEGCKIRSANSTYLQKLVDAANKRWQTPEFKDKMHLIFNSDDWLNKSSNSYLTKNYIMPSGKIERIQGYEDRALDILLKSYHEKDIMVNRKDIQNKIGDIKYTDASGTIRQYIPDFYICSENKIIEVKSKWTYDIQKEKNEQKRLACLNAGLDFEFMIL